MIGMRQVVGLAVALRERAIDCLRSTPVTDEHDQVLMKEIELQNFRSTIAFNANLHGRWYRPMTQDRLSETEPRVLTTNFEYAGVVLNSGRILSDGVTHVSVFNAKNQLQTDYTTHHRLKPASLLKRKPELIIAGTTLHMCAPIATVRGNYGHWLLDGLARWVLLQDRSSESVAIDNFLIPAGQPAFRESLQVLGITDEQIVELPLHKALEFERLVCIARPRGYSSNVTPGWLIDGYRERFAPYMIPAERASRRLYISRRDAAARKFRHEEALSAHLVERGFEIVELSKLGLREKAELFSQASDVVGLTGAGMTSLMFCSPGTRVVEIYPSNFVCYLFATISFALGHEHHPYIFKNTSKISLISRHSGEFDFDMVDFLNLLDSWLQA